MIKDEKTRLLEFLVSIYFGRVRTLKEDQIPELTKFFYKVSKYDIGEHNGSNQNKDIIDSFLKIVEKPKVKEAIRTGKLSEEDFIEKYQERILGDNKRKYSMNDLYSDGLVEKDTAKPYSKKTIFIPAREKVEHSFSDESNETVKITFLGTLYFKEWNGTRASINKYKIQRKNKENDFPEEDVYTDIIMPKMEEPEYRKAVFNELLSYNNIKLSNCGGYIGKIEQAPRNFMDNSESREVQDSYGYSYRISDKYILHYDATELTAAINFQENNVSLETRKDKKSKENDMAK